MQRKRLLFGVVFVGTALGIAVLVQTELDSATLPIETEVNTGIAETSTHSESHRSLQSEERIEEDSVRERTVTLKAGDTLAGLLLSEGIAEAEVYASSSALSSIFDPRNLAVGQELMIDIRPEEDPNGKNCLDSLSFSPATDELVTVKHDSHVLFSSSVEALSHQVQVARRSGTIGTSFYEAALEENIPLPIMFATYQAFSYVLDFQREFRAGDTFEIAYNVYRDNVTNQEHPGEVIFANLSVRDNVFRAYRYTTLDGDTGYFDETGKSLRTGLMKMPVDGARLSSLFGKRKHPILDYTRMHRGVDFAANVGTPIVAAGDGVIVQRGRNGGFGRYIRIRHDDVYSTAYAHLNAYAEDLRVGDNFRQGDVIGFVGSSGLATGPNLHYEVLRNGRQIDPTAITSPPRRVLRGVEMQNFERERKRLLTLVGRLSDMAVEKSVLEEREREVSSSL